MLRVLSTGGHWGYLRDTGGHEVCRVRDREALMKMPRARVLHIPDRLEAVGIDRCRFS
jgi:hypothetical protein